MQPGEMTSNSSVKTFSDQCCSGLNRKQADTLKVRESPVLIVQWSPSFYLVLNMAFSGGRLLRALSSLGVTLFGPVSRSLRRFSTCLLKGLSLHNFRYGIVWLEAFSFAQAFSILQQP
jgi:hypothetical protein